MKAPAAPRSRRRPNVREYGNCACGTFTGRIRDNEPVCDRCFAIEQRIYNHEYHADRRLSPATS